MAARDPKTIRWAARKILQLTRELGNLGSGHPHSDFLGAESMAYDLHEKLLDEARKLETPRRPRITSGSLGSNE